MRYKNPTPNPLPASNEGAKMYLIRAGTAVFRVRTKCIGYLFFIPKHIPTERFAIAY
jgi:hypothetical protein